MIGLVPFFLLLSSFLPSLVNAGLYEPYTYLYFIQFTDSQCANVASVSFMAINVCYTQSLDFAHQATAADSEQQQLSIAETKPTGWRALLACLCGPSSSSSVNDTSSIGHDGTASGDDDVHSGGSSTAVARPRVAAQSGAYVQNTNYAQHSADTNQFGVPAFQIPVPPPYNGPNLLGPLRAADHGKKCLVLDLDETLVHSSFKVSFAFRSLLYMPFLMPPLLCMHSLFLTPILLFPSKSKATCTKCMCPLVSSFCEAIVSALLSSFLSMLNVMSLSLDV